MTTNHVTAPDTQDVETQSTAAIAPTEQFLQFYLATNQAILLSIPELVEVLTIPQIQVIPMFGMPAWVMGVYNCRGEVLWIVDLNHLIGYTPWYQQTGYGSKHTVIVLQQTTARSPVPTSTPREQKVILGVAVNRVDDLVSCLIDSIQTGSSEHLPDGLDEALRPFLQGVWQESSEKVHPILSGAAIFAAMPTTY